MKKALIILICIVLSGCTSPGRKGPDLLTEKERSLPLEHISDTEKSQLYEKTYLEPVSNEGDVFARDLTLTALSKALGSSNKSGYKFNKIDLKKIETEVLCQKYRVLSKLMYEEKVQEKDDPEFIDTEGNQYWSYNLEEDSDSAEIETVSGKVSVLEIMRITALYSMGNEIEQRGSNDKFWKDVGSGTARATGIAFQLALTLAKYMI